MLDSMYNFWIMYETNVLNWCIAHPTAVKAWLVVCIIAFVCAMVVLLALPRYWKKDIDKDE